MSRNPSTDGHSRNVRPEIELLLHCARTVMDAKRAHKIRVLAASGLDWPQLLTLARAHGIMPLLYWHTRTFSAELIPSVIQCKLQNDFHANSRRNLVMFCELLELLTLLNMHQIPAIPFKGPTLAAFVYGNLALRQFRDLDILVPKSEALRARDLLVSRGYKPNITLSRRHEATFLDYQCEFSQVSADTNVIVEIHWGIMPNHMVFPMDLESLWGRLRPMYFSGTTVQSLPPEDLLLVLCAHGAKHCWERLDWICSISEILRAYPELDYFRVLEQARSIGSRRIVFLGLYLADDLLGSVIPDELFGEISEDRAVRTLADAVRRRLFLGAARSPGLFASSIFLLRARERVLDRVRFCFRLAITPTLGDWQVLELPVNLHFVYYLMRPFRLVLRLGSVLLDRARFKTQPA